MVKELISFPHPPVEGGAPTEVVPDHDTLFYLI